MMIIQGKHVVSVALWDSFMKSALQIKCIIIIIIINMTEPSQMLNQWTADLKPLVNKKINPQKIDNGLMFFIIKQKC